jgi:uronate dehydrogenase
VLTGAAGKIASSIRPGVADRVAKLRLVDLDLVEPAHEREESVVADIRDQRGVEAALVGAAGVLHLGALSDEADFHELAEVNIVGTYHVLEAARRTGAGRVVFASSNRVTGFYPRTTLVDPEMPTRPDGFYGVSKIAGEALGRLYSDKFGLQVASLRIGTFEPTPADERQLSTFLAAMTAPELTYTAIYAMSRNSRRWWDLSAGEAVGFDPQDDAERHAADVRAAAQSEAAGPQGGHYASPEYSLDRQR